MTKFYCQDDKILIGADSYPSKISEIYKQYVTSGLLTDKTEGIKRKSRLLMTTGFFDEYNFDVSASNRIKRLDNFKNEYKKFVEYINTVSSNYFENAEKSEKDLNDFIKTSGVSSSIAASKSFQTFGGLSAETTAKDLKKEMDAAEKAWRDKTVNSGEDVKGKNELYDKYKEAKKKYEAQFQKELKRDQLSKYSDEELAKKVIKGEYGSGDARKTALGDRYDAVQKKVNELMNGNKNNNNNNTSANTNTNTKNNTVVSDPKTGSNKTESGATSELEKKLKAKEKELEQAEMEKKKADIAKTEAQDKANRAEAEKQEEEKRRHMAEAEAENAKEEATKLKTENEELKKKLEKTDTPSEVTPQTEPKPEVTPEPTPAEQPKPASEPAPAQEPAQTQPTSQPQKQVYTQPSVQQQTSSTEPVVEIKPNEQIKIEPVTPTEQPTETPTEKPSTTPLPNPNAGDTETGTGSSSKSSGSSVVPIAVGLGAAVAGGIGIKAIHDHRKNSKFDDQNEDSVTNGNRFWTDEDPNVMHTEEDLFNENIDENVTSYQAVENNSVTPDLDTNINNDTWSIEEDEIADNNTFDLLSENN